MLIEAKNVARNAQYSDYSAVGDNLQTNVRNLVERIRSNFADYGLTQEQSESIVKALNNGDVDIRIMLGPNAPEIGARSNADGTLRNNSLLNKLEQNAQRVLGPNARVLEPERVQQSAIQQAQAAAQALEEEEMEALDEER